MYSVLPVAIQSRLPPLPSIRRTVSSPITRGSKSGSPASSGSTTPISEAETTVMDVSRTDFAEATFALEKSTFSSGLNVIATPTTKLSGVDWRCGRQGMDLVVNAVHESKGQMSSNYNARFERAAYLDGVAYMLKGLPHDLDETEITVLQRSMPSAVRESYPAITYGEDDSAAPASQASRNIVHSGLLFIFVYILACIRWLTPYVLLFFSELMRYEREYKVSENVLGTTMAGVTVSLGAVRRFSDGVAGQVLAEAFEYTAEGVSAALKDFAKEVGSSNGTMSANSTSLRHRGSKRQR